MSSKQRHNLKIGKQNDKKILFDTTTSGVLIHLVQ